MSTRHHQMPQVIGFKVQTVGKRTFLIPRYGTNHGFFSVNRCLVAFLNDDGGYECNRASRCAKVICAMALSIKVLSLGSLVTA